MSNERVLNSISDEPRTWEGLTALLQQVDWTFREMEAGEAATAAENVYFNALEYALQMRTTWRDDVTHLHDSVNVSKLVELWNSIATGPGNKLKREEWI